MSVPFQSLYASASFSAQAGSVHMIRKFMFTFSVSGFLKITLPFISGAVSSHTFRMAGTESP